MIRIINRCLLAVGFLFCLTLSFQLSSADNFDNNLAPEKLLITNLINQVKESKCDTLPQTLFWETLMNTPKDTLLINISSNRQVIETVNAKEWKLLSKSKKVKIINGYKKQYCLTKKEKIYITSGKKSFYNYSNIDSVLNKGLNIFYQNNTDPFYALSILLIESPSKMQRSKSGAHGHFQIMKAVARQMGLKVNKYVDERKDFEKSAWAAAKLIKTICIPEVNKILATYNLTYNPSDLWYRLLVLHVYHAGAFNVKRAINTIPNKQTNISLITTLWNTSIGNFRNQSQNYSQIVLAAILKYSKKI